MAVWRYVDFSVKEAQHLADLASIEVDLKTAEDICDLFDKSRQQWEPGELEAFVLFEALCTAAIVRYGRSFSDGVREKIPLELIKQLPREHQEAHSFFWNLRNKWVAHSVNAFEFTQVVAHLTPEERGPKSVSSISVRPNRIAFLGVQDMLRLKKLASTVRRRITRLIKNEEQKVLSHARSLPPNQFYAKDDPPPKLVGDKDAGKPRRKW